MSLRTWRPRSWVHRSPSFLYCRSLPILDQKTLATNSCPFEQAGYPSRSPERSPHWMVACRTSCSWFFDRPEHGTWLGVPHQHPIAAYIRRYQYLWEGLLWVDLGKEGSRFVFTTLWNYLQPTYTALYVPLVTELLRLVPSYSPIHLRSKVFG